jgi:hypothetical protein
MNCLLSLFRVLRYHLLLPIPLCKAGVGLGIGAPLKGGCNKNSTPTARCSNWLLGNCPQPVHQLVGTTRAIGLRYLPNRQQSWPFPGAARYFRCCYLHNWIRKLSTSQEMILVMSAPPRDIYLVLLDDADHSIVAGRRRSYQRRRDCVVLRHGPWVALVQ